MAQQGLSQQYETSHNDPVKNNKHLGVVFVQLQA